MFLFRCCVCGTLLAAFVLSSSPMQADDRKKSSKSSSKRDSDSRSDHDRDSKSSSKKEREKESKNSSKESKNKSSRNRSDEGEDSDDSDDYNYGQNFGNQGYSQPQYQQNYQPNYGNQYGNQNGQYGNLNGGQFYQVQPVHQSIPAPPKFDGGPIVLANPVTNDKSIEYSLNGHRFTIRPGQSQTFSHDRNWVVDFSRGEGLGTAQYTLKAVAYKFKPTTRGWELFESTASIQPPLKSPATPVDDPSPVKNDIKPVAAPEFKSAVAPVTAPTIKPAASPATSSKTTSGSQDFSDEQVIRQRKLPMPPMPNPESN